MDHVPRRLARWWRSLDDRGRVHSTALGLVGLGYIAHYLVYCVPQPFFIEDAGISFAYARNVVDGEGFATYPGGERVEGFSNALWTFLCAIFYALGVSPWTSAKIMGAVFGVLTLPLVYDLTRRARPGLPADVALLPPLMLAASPQFVIWNASGLENSLFCLLLAAGMRGVVAELDDAAAGAPAVKGPPRSALWLSLLCMTRPEGPAYAAIGALGVTLGNIHQRRWRPILAWLLTFLLPTALFHAWRYSYFGWPFPNTYYAKKVDGGGVFKPWNWTGGGWKYINNYFKAHGIVYVLPLLGIATLGLSRWRKWLLVPLCLVLGVLLFWDGREYIGVPPAWFRDVQRLWVNARVWSIGGAVVLLGLSIFGRPGWLARCLLWASASFAVFFALYSGGDWMKAHRWFNHVSVSLFPLLALGLGELIDLFLLPRPEADTTTIDRRPLWRLLAFAPVALTWVGVEAWRSSEFAQAPETAVRDVHRRVTYMTWVQERLDVDHVTLLDVDMGAHMYFSGWDIVDLAGLVDVTMARHQKDFSREFMEDYVFGERNPEFAHVHSGWAKTSKIPQLKVWKERYIEIPGFPSGGRQLHVGNHIRKDLLALPDTSPLGPEAARFEQGLRLLSITAPAPEVAPGGQLFLDTAWKTNPRKAGFRILAFLDDGQGHQASAALAPGYDWYKPDEWKPDEKVLGRYRLNVPTTLPEGEYDVGIVLLDEATGEVIEHVGRGPEPEAPPAPLPLATDSFPEAAPPAVEAAPPAVQLPPVEFRYLPGELITGLRVKIVSREAAHAAAEADLSNALELAQDPSLCGAAWGQWKNATRHVSRDEDWQTAGLPRVKRAIAGCYLAAAEATADRRTQTDALITARSWDHHHPEIAGPSAALADTYEAEGDQAAAEGDAQAAYTAYATVMRLDPSRATVRKRAEAARDERLAALQRSRPARSERIEKADKANKIDKEEEADEAGGDEAEAGAGGDGA